MDITYSTEIKAFVYLHSVEGKLSIGVTTEAADLEKVPELVSYRETSVTYPGILPVEETEDATGDDDSTDGGSVASDTGADSSDSAGEELPVE